MSEEKKDISLEEIIQKLREGARIVVIEGKTYLLTAEEAEEWEILKKAV